MIAKRGIEKCRGLASACVVGLLAALIISAPSPVDAEELAAADEDRELEVGAMVGGSWNLLSSPTDPEGEFTFLWGSMFSGYGSVLGATGSMKLTEIKGMPVRLTGDLLYGYHRGAGYAGDRNSDAQIDVQFTSHVIRLPVLARLNTSATGSAVTFGVGMEPIFGMMTSATVELTDIDASVQPVETTPTTGMAAVMAAGFDWQRGDMTIPIDMRVAWNPFVASASEERFKDFDSPQEPGDFRVAFDWQIMMTAGVRWGI